MAWDDKSDRRRSYPLTLNVSLFFLCNSTLFLAFHSVLFYFVPCVVCCCSALKPIQCGYAMLCYVMLCCGIFKPNARSHLFSSPSCLSTFHRPMLRIRWR